MSFCAALVLLASCGTQTQVIYARAARYPAEAEGFMRVATDEAIPVNVVGTDLVDEKNVAGYVLLAPDDLAQLVRNTEELLKLKEK